MKLPGESKPHHRNRSERWSVEAALPEERSWSKQSAALPIRLSVAQGGLGLELCAPMDLGTLIVEELDVALIGVRYPVDLSKGVKHFRSKRSRLRHASLRVDLERLSRMWAKALVDHWGEGVELRLRPAFQGDSQGANEALKFASNEVLRANDGGTASSLAVSIYNESSSLAFDLLLSSGASPRFLVDCPRVVGRNESPLFLALRALDAGLRAALPTESVLRRSGRAVEINRLSEAVCLAVLPQLGCRLPQIVDQVVRCVRIERGDLFLTLGLREEPFTAGKRALRLSAFADFVAEGDQLNGSGDLEGARSSYLEALDAAQGHTEILQELAELDLAAGNRAESALSFLLEMEANLQGPPSLSLEARTRHQLALALALSQSGRDELAREAWDRALDLESDAVFAAVLGLLLAERASTNDEKRKYLDLAVGRAPFFAPVRLQRFQIALKEGDLDTASLDAERLDASKTDPQERSRWCLKIGKAFSELGHDERALEWLSRSLRLQPDEPEQMIALAFSLEKAGQELRSAELFQAAIRRLNARRSRFVDSVHPEEGSVARVEQEQALRAEAHYRLALLLAASSDSIPMALGSLSAVETRSHVGAEARILEAELHAREGRSLARDRAISRLMEALELGWVDLKDCEMRLRVLLDAAKVDGDPSLLEFAAKVLEK